MSTNDTSMAGSEGLIQALDMYMRQDETAGDTDNGVYRRAKEAMSHALSTTVASREQAGAVIGWLYDWTSSSALGKPDEHFTSFTEDEAYARRVDHRNARAITLAAPGAALDAREPLTDEQIATLRRTTMLEPHQARASDLAFARAIESALASRQEAPAASGAPDASSLVPGQMHCARCKFQLTRTVLYTGNGAVGAGDSKTEPCPNGCGPLWPVTWEQAARDAWATCETMFERAKKAEDALEAVGGPHLVAAPTEALSAATVAQPMFFASPEQANALQDRPDDSEGGVYLPVRKTAAGKFTMPLYAAQPCASQGCGGAGSESPEPDDTPLETGEGDAR